MLSKGLVHLFSSCVTTDVFQRQPCKTNCIAVSTTSYKVYRSSRNTPIPRMEELTFMSSTRDGELKYFNQEARHTSPNIYVDSRLEENIRNGIFLTIMLFLISALKLRFKRLKLKVIFPLLFEVSYPNIIH